MKYPRSTGLCETLGGGVVSVALLACFHPAGQGTTDTSVGTDASEATSTVAPTTSSTATSSSSSTASSSEPTSTASASTAEPSTGATTGGSVCGNCAGDTPHCDVNLGQCVACLVAGDCAAAEAPICDGGQCRGCREHAECGDTACELDVGKCFPETAKQLGVLPGSGGCKNSSCSLEKPCCSVAAAVASKPGSPYIVVHLTPGPNSTQDTEVIHLVNSDQRIAVLGVGAPRLAGVMDKSPVVWLDDPKKTSKLFLAGIVVDSAQGGAAVSCTGGKTLWIDDSPITNGLNTGLYVSNCGATVRRAYVGKNANGLTIADNGRATLINSFVGASVAEEVVVTANGVLVANYSTIVHAGGVPLIQCGGLAKSEIRNSALITSPPAPGVVNCNAGTLQLDHSVVSEMAAVSLGSGNVAIDMPADATDPFMDFDGFDWRVVGDGGKLKDVALWEIGDPPTDYNGTARPTIDASPDVAGADRN